MAARRRVSSRLLYPETRAAIARIARMGRLPASELRGARRRVESLWEDLGRIELEASLARRAADLAEEHALKAYDAVHLASLLDVADEETVLAAADGQLKAAAQALGLAVARLP